METRKIIAVVVTIGILLTFISLIIFTLNPFKTLPSINISEAYWRLGKEGYILHLNISTTAPVQLITVDVGGVLHDVAYDVDPPSTVVEIPMKNIDSKVVLHFDVGSPKEVYPKSFTESTNLRLVYGLRHLFLMGVLSNPGTAFVLPVPKEVKVLVVTAPNERYRISRYMDLEDPNFRGTVIEADEVSMDILRNATTIVFIDIMPEPSLLNTLLKERKAVVAYVFARSLGELRFDIASNGTVIIRRYSPDVADIDYFGAHCVLHSRGYLADANNNVVKSLISLYGRITYSYVISPSTYCQRNVVEVYAATKFSEVVIGKVSTGFYFISSLFRHALTLASIGFFESEAKGITVVNLNPFRGIYPLPVRPYESAYQVSILAGGVMHTIYAEKPSGITYTIRENTTVIDISTKDKAMSTYKIRVEEYTYDYDMLRVVVDKNMTVPTSLQISYTPFHAYLLYIDNVPKILIADEAILDSRPLLTIEYSSIYELFSLKVSRYDSIPSPLILSVNGRDVLVLDSSNRAYESYNRRTGYFSIVVRDVYGRVIESWRFRVTHIYESPLFIVAMLSAGASVSTFIYAMRKKEEKEVEEIRMIFYRIPEVEKRIIDEYVVEESVSRMLSTQKVSPLLSSVIEDLYKRHPLLQIVNEIVTASKDLLTKKRKVYGLYSRYVPELDDTITIIGPKTNLKKDFYTHVIAELLKKFGGSITYGDIMKDIIDVDSVITVGNKMLLVTYATTSDIRDAIDRGLTSFAKIRRFKLPFTLIGLAIVTEPKYVKAINDVIDKILNQDDETASKILRDMTVYTHHIRTASRDAWLSKYIIVAVPITRIAPLLAFAKAGAVRLCNKYYRILY